MKPELDFKVALNNFIESFFNNVGNISIEELRKNGFIVEDGNDCKQFVLSILYKLEPVYNSTNVDSNIKNNILELWNKLVRQKSYFV